MTNSMQLPDFSLAQIKIADKQLFNELEQIDQQINHYLLQDKKENWEEICQPLINLENNVLLKWSVISHLNNVASNDIVRALYEKCLPKIIDFQIKLNQNPDLYQQIKRMDNHPALSIAQKKAIFNSLRDFKLTGINLPKTKKEQFNKLQQELSSLQNKFSQNTIDSTQEWKKLLTQDTQLAGVPKKEQESLKTTDGWQVGTDFHSYQTITKYAQNRKLREEVYYHYVIKSSELENAKYDNAKIMNDIINKRQEVAQLLDFTDYVDLSLFNKMAESKKSVQEFLDNLIARVKPLAKKEWQDLCEFAKKQKFNDKLQAWDITFFSNLLRQEKFDFDEEILREYFPLPKVLSGLFLIANKLFSIEIKEDINQVSTWHQDVRFFSLYKDNNLIGQFYLDIYARENKRSGAWMDECKIRSKVDNSNIQLPVAYLICNFNKPKLKQPTLLYHSEVTTLFHEFGHTLHHLLTTIDILPVAGIQGVPWDAVEVPSQLLENWCWQLESMPYISEHYINKNPLPIELLKTVIKAKNFQAGLKLMRQLEFALFDYTIHKKNQVKKPKDILDILQEIRRKTSLYPVPEYNRFPNSFNHIFSGGYAAGYYSYLWAEVIACDLFAVFKKQGMLSNKIGNKFITDYLGQGGSQCPKSLFYNFAGRDFSIEPFLNHHGLNLT